MRRRTEYWIFKDCPDPEWWDGPFKKLSQAKLAFARDYINTIGKWDARQDFVVAKVSISPIPVKR